MWKRGVGRVSPMLQMKQEDEARVCAFLTLEEKVASAVLVTESLLKSHRKEKMQFLSLSLFLASSFVPKAAQRCKLGLKLKSQHSAC